MYIHHHTAHAHTHTKEYIEFHTHKDREWEDLVYHCPYGCGDHIASSYNRIQYTLLINSFTLPYITKVSVLLDSSD